MLNTKGVVVVAIAPELNTNGLADGLAGVFAPKMKGAAGVVSAAVVAVVDSDIVVIVNGKVGLTVRDSTRF